MKASSNKFAVIESSTLEILTKEVKETLAPADLLHQHKVFSAADLLHQHKVFSAADLWNIQRQTRSRVQRRFL